MNIERAFRDLLPDGAAVAVSSPDAEPPRLFPEEVPAAANMVVLRRREFALGRDCARRALMALAVAPTALPMRPDRSPRWPPSVVGSITHWDGWCAAAVAPTATYAALGIDGERRRPLPDGVRALVLTASEQAWLQRIEPASHWDMAVFVMKEAVYKAWAPLTGLWLGFEDVQLTVDADGGTFRARLLGTTVPPSLTRGLDGRFAIGKDAVLAAVAVPN